MEGTGNDFSNTVPQNIPLQKLSACGRVQRVVGNGVESLILQFLQPFSTG